jgi:hypothetical protein
MADAVETGRITTAIPARMDELPWARWHWLVVIGLGTVWILDGLEVTIVGSMSDALKPASTGLGMSSYQIGVAGAVYVAGACVGALFFGQLTDRFGPGQVPRTHRRRDQRIVLGRRRRGVAAHHPAARPEQGRPGLGLADRLRARRDPGGRHPAGAPPRAGEPAAAVHPRS